MNKEEAVRRAEGAVSQGRPADALGYLWPLLSRPHIADQELGRYLAIMERAYLALDRRRAAGSIRLYRGDHAGAAQLVRNSPTDMARADLLRRDYPQAARRYEEAGWLGHAAIQLEEAGADRSARLLWERLANDQRLSDDPYIRGLVRFNLSRTCERLGDTDAARREKVASMHAIEAAADLFETIGQRERAFDAYQVLIQLGQQGAFENLAEGYLGCIRILAEDQLRYYVLQYYEDFVAIAEQRGELHAAATIYREAAQFCRRLGLAFENHYRLRGAEAQLRAAERMLASGGMPEMAENAYAAAIDGFNDLGLYSRVRAVYAALAQLPLGEKRQARYARLEQRLAGVQDEELQTDGFPDYLRMDTAYPEIWRLDVIEWEQAGDPAETMGEVILDGKTPEYIRRNALLCRLRQLGAGDDWTQPTKLVQIAEDLGRVGIYQCLAPLEVLVEHDDDDVRAAVLRAARQLYFKRTFIIVMRGLRDESSEVRDEALQAVSALNFTHAYDPLQRIFRESSSRSARAAALGSIGKMSSLEAAEFLLEVMRHGTPEERQQAAALMKRADHPDVDAILHRAIADEPGELGKQLQSVLRARGG